MRSLWLQEHPDCRVCGARADVVDHVQSIRVAPERRLDPSNLQSLCREHHQQKSMRSEGTLGKPRRPA
jgi:5-methylcytosine-specific restriction endonuclease McrA